MNQVLKYFGVAALSATLFGSFDTLGANLSLPRHVCAADALKTDNRPAEPDRLFKSKAVEAEIKRVSKLLKNPKLVWMFTNCFPNTLDTTVH